MGKNSKLFKEDSYLFQKINNHEIENIFGVCVLKGFFIYQNSYIYINSYFKLCPRSNAEAQKRGSKVKIVVFRLRLVKKKSSQDQNSLNMRFNYVSILIECRLHKQWHPDNNWCPKRVTRFNIDIYWNF